MSENYSVDLKEYYPPAIKQIDLIREASRVIDKMNDKVWDDLEAELKDCFIATCSEKRIGELEDFLGIIPSPESSLEYRRRQVQAAWNLKIPYTINALRLKLDAICGKQGDYDIDLQPANFLFHLILHDEADGTADAIIKLLETMLPAALDYWLENAKKTILSDAVYAGALLSSFRTNNLI